jgi:hypothetical protein
MKIHTLLALAVMAATGCQTTKPEPQVQALAPPPKPFVPKFQPGLDMMGIAPSTVVFNDAPAQQPAVIVPSGTYPVTRVTPNAAGGSTVVNYGLPYYRPPIAPYPYYGY